MRTDKIRVAASGYKNFTPGITRIQGGIHICTVAPGESCSLILYEEGKKEGRRIPFPPGERVGNVWSMDLLGEDFSGLEYTLEVDGEEFPDPCGREYTGRERWGDKKAVGKGLRSRFAVEDYDWEGDSPLRTPLEETVIYRLHVRGFTKHASSQVTERGTFLGVAEKIPYLKELGVTAVELLPVNEFEEVQLADGADGNPDAGGPTGRLNYWGYGKSWYFAPKASYACGQRKEPGREFKDLVKALHSNGLEIYIELYFSGEESASMVQEAVRFWVSEYHVDGVHLVGFGRTGLLAADPLLADTKLFAVSWEEEEGRLSMGGIGAGGCRGWQKGPGKSPLGGKERQGQSACDAGEKGPGKRGSEGKRRLAEYNDGFLVDMRRVLKGDESQMQALIFRTKRNPKTFGTVNYMASTNGFTMMDMVSYEVKHNEANGEENRDGTDYNYTWNCGAEGPSRKKKILEMRRRQLCNAYLLLFLSQGTPLLLAGDEFGNSQGGNNNAYCQDNETSWLNWNLLKSNGDLADFVKAVIAFRKRHPVFHGRTEPKNIDYLVCGHPDVSYHGVKAWCPEFENFRRQLGVMYCGEYGKKEDGTVDDYFYVAYNMHWEPHEFALPKLPKGMKWHQAINTESGVKGIYREGEEPILESQKEFMVPARSIVVFIGLKEQK